ncbi:uncharacterized protein B0H64DRAFT_371647 [Chaetomium fimeti]|uniref:Uncharacterized protein n=1 Tax=Chaetomium fimeti TaxID=1854472 RepID=A0AAE0HMG9_9PEZI|nr:hypothetical protein B0H64DRAFT_371647 [Chaetomium fimeti]
MAVAIVKGGSSEHLNIEDALKLPETILNEAIDSKDCILSNMYHGIRTPLIRISGMASFTPALSAEAQCRGLRQGYRTTTLRHPYPLFCTELQENAPRIRQTDEKMGSDVPSL